MVQIISPESVARKSRKDLTLDQWGDLTVIDQLAKLFKKGEQGNVFTQEDQTTIKIVMERFAWLAAKAEDSGYGEEPSILQGSCCEINREWVEYYARRHNKDVLQVAAFAEHVIQQRIERMQRSIAEFKEVASSVRYEPAADEPSVYSNNGNYQPSTEWLLWYSKKNGIGIVQCHEVACGIMQQLARELTRQVSVQPPAQWLTDPEFKKAGINRTVLSMQWVVWYKYTQNVDWIEAHLKGTEVTLHRA